MHELFRRLSPDFYVAPQLTPDDLAAARALGIRTVINNRPDGEAPDQTPEAAMRAAAAAQGLSYAFVPVVSGHLTPACVRAFMDAVDSGAGPYLAYCRSGTRSCFMWALTAARERPAREVIEAAADAGYDVSPLTPVLERIAAGEEP